MEDGKGDGSGREEDWSEEGTRKVAVWRNWWMERDGRGSGFRE